MKKTVCILLALMLASCTFRPATPPAPATTTAAEPTAITEPTTAEPTTIIEPTTAEPTTIPEPTTIADPTEQADPTIAEPTTAEPPITADPTTPAIPTESPDPIRAYTDGEYTANGYKVEVIGGVTYVGGILIANKTYPLPETYAPGDLTPDTLAAYYAMCEAAIADGIAFRFLCGYRSYYDQQWIYNDYLTRDSKESVDRYSARPGYSEHQTGMAIDVCSLDESFGETPEGKWLAANCARFGFIIRYGKSKEAVTGYKYEPWHIRYVGVPTAEAVSTSGLCLEEYLGIDSVYADQRP